MGNDLMTDPDDTSAITLTKSWEGHNAGAILTIGSVEAVQNSDNERVQDLLQRRFDEEDVDPDAYLARLTRTAP